MTENEDVMPMCQPTYNARDTNMSYVICFKLDTLYTDFQHVI